ncbi:adhesion G-protein coupled receptor G2-like isoform X1 [Scomber scombrus]|uniref:Adhesion G-protein coupled receptor G2-like isoform X1 n=1 Tax=Scomber scombrus TaxID=13677 RepID=A0AAV1NDJ1_SCOSC
MFPLDVKHRWMFLMKIAILFFGIFLKHNVCDCTADSTLKKYTLITFIKVNEEHCLFPSKMINNTGLCVNDNNAECCTTTNFDCAVDATDIGGGKYIILLNETALSKQDIIVMTDPNQSFDCLPSQLYYTDFLSEIKNCTIKAGLGTMYILNQTVCQDASYDEGACNGSEKADYSITLLNDNKIECASCESENIPIDSKPITLHANDSNPENIMNNLNSLLELMNNSTAATFTIGDVKGAILKLKKDPPKMDFAITKSGNMSIFKKSNDLVKDFARVVQIPKEASDMAVKRNGTFAGVFLFPGIHQEDSNGYLINNEMMGIEMGAMISNLSDTIDIHYTKKGNVASCRSWNGNGTQNWTTNGCETKETNDSITCRCSHLTFFAILMSPVPANISSSDFTSLTYITNIGCGLSMFFLAVALFMHWLIRKGKASQATKILINLFVAMFTLNLSFLINETIANIENFGVCVAMAAVMHYTLLATFSWFFIQGLHLYFNLWKFPGGIKHYMTKICIAGWVIPAPVVIALVVLNKYGMLVIQTNGGISAKMCWISDAVLQQWVNVGYYGVVFIFTLSIFIITVYQIVLFKQRAVKTDDHSSTKINTFSILGLFLLLGITWAFAFFSHGPLLIPSYYIFTILNSLQGFLLFIYYYSSSKIVGEDRGSSVDSSSSTKTSHTVITSPYQ